MVAKKKARNSGILLLAHGSPEPGVETEAESLRRKLTRAGRGRRFYALAWLNRKPDLMDGVDSLAKKGCHNVQILPLLVFRGKHFKRDVPRLLSDAQRRHPEMKMTLGSHLTGLPGFARWFSGETATPAGRSQ